MDEKRACKGAPTITILHAGGDFEKCQACGAMVAWDLVDDPFWGFKNCCQRKEDAKS